MNGWRMPFLQANINHEPVLALLDSGSSLSLMNYNWYLRHREICKFSALRPVGRSCKAANGHELKVVGQVRVSCSIGKFSWPINIIVVSQLCVDLLLGGGGFW